MGQLGIADAERTPQGRCVLYVKATGERVEKWPVDGKDMLNQGDWQVENPNAPAGEVVKEEAAVEPAPAASPVEDPVPHLKPPAEHSPGVPLDTGPAGQEAGKAKLLDPPSGAPEDEAEVPPVEDEEPQAPVVDPAMADAEAAVAAAEAAVLAATTEGARKKLRKELATLRRRLTITRKRVEAAKE